MNKTVGVVGAGFAGLAASTVLASKGLDVIVFEKNNDIGGRARAFRSNGYVFDMGPSWYWMPDVFEHYFSQFGKRCSDYYTLQKLDPAFQIFFGKEDVIQVPASISGIIELIDSLEENGADKFKRFMAEAEKKYNLAIHDLVYMPSEKLREFLKPAILKNIFSLSLFRSYHAHVRRYFTNPRVIRLMEFPILFLGGTSKKTPALFSLMNYAAFQLSTWYPMGGFSVVGEGMRQLAEEMGVRFKTNEAVKNIGIKDGKVEQVSTAAGAYRVSGLVAAADYAHMESLMHSDYRNHSDAYWKSRTFSPSALIFYLGVTKKIKALLHHNLFFDAAFEAHAAEIYDRPAWPASPLFYVCCPSKTDDAVAPAGHENLFILMPVAPGIEDTEAVREQYFNTIMNRIEKITGESVSSCVDFKRSYCINDFQSDYNAYKGNAYGLANTFMQTAFLRPAIRNKKVNNLFYAGQLTVPGPGVPPALISGQIAANQLMNILNQ